VADSREIEGWEVVQLKAASECQQVQKSLIRGVLPSCLMGTTHTPAVCRHLQRSLDFSGLLFWALFPWREESVVLRKVSLTAILVFFQKQPA
jgi:hypothetical protein